MHLTGIKCVDKNGICKNANQFFHACLKNKLSEKNIIIKPDGTTKLKLDVLSQFVAIDKKCKMIGTYNNTKNDLTTEMLIGNINICLGFVTNESEYYIPNTLLKEDIRKRVIKPFPIIGILKKKVDEEKYQIVTYMKKSMNMNKIKENKELYNKINIELLENYSTSKQLKTVSFYKVD